MQHHVRGQAGGFQKRPARRVAIRELPLSFSLLASTYNINPFSLGIAMPLPVLLAPLNGPASQGYPARGPCVARTLALEPHWEKVLRGIFANAPIDRFSD